MSFHSSPERDEALRCLLERSAGDADLWTVAALRRAAGEDADLLFPDGPSEIVEAWCDLGDRTLLREAREIGLGSRPRVSDRVREAMLLRLPRDAPGRDAARRALAVLAQPGQRPRALRAAARTADAIWIAAGDSSTGLSRHTRRATAGAVWTATLLYAFRNGDDPDAVAAFLDRRLAGVARVGRLRRRLGSVVGRARSAS